MKSLTPDKALSGECGFMAANLYAKSIFGEDALANVSLEKNPAKPDATVTGHIRIRAKSQGKCHSSHYLQLKLLSGKNARTWDSMDFT